MSKLLLVSSQDTVISFPKEENFNSFSAKENLIAEALPKQINASQNSTKDVIFAVNNSLSELKSIQNKINFLSEELLVLLKKP